ncbi:MAG: M50 family metallopeptidase [Archaeoglobaceae archaeon]|nr:M50 family metallopeptidase [Archaeoglobaceae archaeon]MDW8128569.1 M50 family metallopeptidase [Archaeoglobaceae archaeon]
MDASLRIARIKGIEITIHWSLFIILFVLSSYFYTSTEPFGFANLKEFERIAFSILASVFVFIAVLIHELAHSLVAMRFGVKVKGIMLFIFGGVAMMEKIPKNPKEELAVALAGPFASLAIALLSFIISINTKGGLSMFFLINAYFNSILTIFNLIPAFPMDGGRVLRSIIARRTSYSRATKTAAGIGKAIAIAMGIIGFFAVNIWLMLIALFIYLGASEEEKIVTAEDLFSRFSIGDIMTKEVISVTPDTRIGEVIELMFKHKHLGYPVVKDGELVGIVTLKDIMNADPNTRIEEVMSKELLTLSPKERAFEAFRIMSEKGIGRIPVVEDGKLVGIVSRSDLMKIKELLEFLEVLEWKRSS